MDQFQDDRLPARLLVVEGDGRITVTTNEEPAAWGKLARWIPGMQPLALGAFQTNLYQQVSEIGGHRDGLD
jgi:hypothetical protein